MNLSHLSLAIAVSLVGFATLWLVSVDRHMPNVGEPTIDPQKAVTRVDLEVPPIRDFEHYYGSLDQEWRHLNPFVPWQQRAIDRTNLEKEERRRIVRRKRPQVARNDPPPADAIPPGPQPKAPPRPPREPPKPDRPELPPADFGATLVPEVVGFIGDPNGERLKVRFDEDEPAIGMRPGEEQLGWTFVGVRLGQAEFVDADGARHTFPIGEEGIQGVTELAIAGGSGGGDDAAGSPASIPQDSDALLEMIQNDPRGRRMLEQQPGLRRMIEQNPDQARRLLEQYLGGGR